MDTIDKLSLCAVDMTPKEMAIWEHIKKDAQYKSLYIDHQASKDADTKIYYKLDSNIHDIERVVKLIKAKFPPADDEEAEEEDEAHLDPSLEKFSSTSLEEAKLMEQKTSDMQTTRLKANIGKMSSSMLVALCLYQSNEAMAADQFQMSKQAFKAIVLSGITTLENGQQAIPMVSTVARYSHRNIYILDDVASCDVILRSIKHQMTIGKAGELAQDLTDADPKNPACLVWNSPNGQQDRVGYKLEDTTPGAIGSMVEDIGITQAVTSFSDRIRVGDIFLAWVYKNSGHVDTRVARCHRLKTNSPYSKKDGVAWPADTYNRVAEVLKEANAAREEELKLERP